jgi:predicted secreted protein
MGLASGLMVYFIVWWTILFAILPWGVKTDPETGQIGAPKAPQL